jgi:phage terminase small subunit
VGADCVVTKAWNIMLADTRRLSPRAVALYAGAKMTKYGIEISMHDKGAAMETLFKHLGLYEKDNQQKTDPLAALLHSIANGNGNGFRPVANDPEAPEAPAGTSGFMPRQDVDDGATG